MPTMSKIKTNSDFGAEIAKFLPLIAREFTRRQKNILSRGLLTIPQVVILEFLVERGSSQMNELAKVLNLTMSAVTAIVDKMVKMKLVKRERPQEDRRVVNVILLKKGGDAAKRVRQARRDCANDLFSCLTEEDKTEYIKILTKVHNHLRQRQ